MIFNSCKRTNAKLLDRFFVSLFEKYCNQFLTFFGVSLKVIYFDMNQNKITRTHQYEVPIFSKRYAADDGK